MPEETTTTAHPIGLPIWLTATVILVDLGLMSFNVIVFGPEGYATTVILGGILGVYGGVNELVRHVKGRDS